VADEDFYFAHCPERINPGDERFTVANIPRVIGARTNDSSLAAAAFYRSILETKTIKTTTLKEAESVKMVENAFRDINIAYVNELAMSFDRLGIDIHNVIDAASTKPFGFMPHFPGCGVGGHCIPVDPYYLIDYAEKNGFSHTFIKTARQINSDMPGYTIDRLEEALDSTGMDLPGTKVALLGLAYKRGIADCRESPAFVILDELRERGAHVIAYDPYVPEKSDRNTLEETLTDAEAIIIATDHTIFKDLVPEDLKKHGIRVVVDGRNCLLKEAFTSAGITYRGIGR
jgi:nucleotide sugar dehydrogenase